MIKKITRKERRLLRRYGLCKRLVNKNDLINIPVWDELIKAHFERNEDVFKIHGKSPFESTRAKFLETKDGFKAWYNDGMNDNMPKALK